MIFADTQETTYAAVILGFLMLLLTVLQTLWSDWRAKRNAATIKSEVVVAAKEVKKTAEEAAGTAEAGNKKLDKVYDAVNGKGLMGVLSRVEKKVDEQGKALIDHIKDDAGFQGKLSEQFSSLETFIKGSPLPPAGGEMTVELHGTATMNKEAT
jgi:DNA anti-recombination protein RmuC